VVGPLRGLRIAIAFIVKVVLSCLCCMGLVTKDVKSGGDLWAASRNGVESKQGGAKWHSSPENTPCSAYLPCRRHCRKTVVAPMEAYLVY
jgi:hypothetical protein